MILTRRQGWLANWIRFQRRRRCRGRYIGPSVRPERPGVGQVWLIPPHRSWDVAYVVTLLSCDAGWEMGSGAWHSTPGENWWQCAKSLLFPSDGEISGAQVERLRERDDVLRPDWIYLGRIQDWAKDALQEYIGQEKRKGVTNDGRNHHSR